MSVYDFSPLSPPEFEDLARDLLQEQLHVSLESFANGRDRGIDFRYSSALDGQLVVQCKHWLSSGYAKLLSHLKSSELHKIARLSPARYVLVTSVPLTPQNKDEIVSALAPFVVSTADVVGPDDLNNWLGLSPAVERRHFKLWIASAEVLKAVLHNGLYGRSEALLQSMLEKSKFFVEVPEFRRAKRLLDDHHYCLILGPAGIGKTILAEMLCLGYAGEGFEIVVVSEDVQEAFELRDPGRQQVFYYDDFLGQAAVDEKLPKNEDSRLGQFIEAVKRSENHRFVMTTREYLLPQAEAAYPKLRRAQLEESLCIVTLEGLDVVRRARMLYNHVFHSRIPDEALANLLLDRAYMRIVQHQNFNPRVVERMTRYLRSVEVPGEAYVEVFLENLDNPSQMWDEVISQLSPLARDTVLVASALSATTTMDCLNRATDAYRLTRSRLCGITVSAESRMEALRELDGSFIKTDLLGDGKTRSVSIQNPSLREHLQRVLVEDKSAAQVAMSSAQYIEQVLALVRLDKGRSLLDPTTVAEAAVRCWSATDGFVNVVALRRVIPSFTWSPMHAFHVLEPIVGQGAAALWDAVGPAVENSVMAQYSVDAGMVAHFLRPDPSHSVALSEARLRMTMQIRQKLGPLLAGQYQPDLFKCADAVVQFCQVDAAFATESEMQAVRDCLDREGHEEAARLVEDEGLDADDFWAYVDVIERIGTELDVGLDRAIGVLERAATEKTPEEREDDSYDDYEPSPQDPLGAVHSMFDGLAEQIAEARQYE